MQDPASTLGRQTYDMDASMATLRPNIVLMSWSVIALGAVQPESHRCERHEKVKAIHRVGERREGGNAPCSEMSAVKPLMPIVAAALEVEESSRLRCHGSLRAFNEKRRAMAGRRAGARPGCLWLAGRTRRK